MKKTTPAQNPKKERRTEKGIAKGPVKCKGK